MPVTDKREPGVYVTIEDASYAAPPLETGRIVYAVILCEKGPHNRIVTITSKEQFFALFGKPNYRKTSQTHYMIEKALSYTGKVLVVRVMEPTDADWSNRCIIMHTAGSATTGGTLYTFVEGSNEIDCADEASYNEFNIGEWIYHDNDNASYARQVVAKSVDDPITPTIWTYTLDANYESSAGGPIPAPFAAEKHVPYEFSTSAGIYDAASMGETKPGSDGVVYWFYANGAGSYYNNLIIKGVRNTELELFYIDDDEYLTDGVTPNPEYGEPLYPYMFMNLALYEVNTAGVETLLEGPWPVSLIPRYPTGESVKDLTTGTYMFIEEVINSNSDLIRCKASNTLASGEPGTEFSVVTDLIDSTSSTDAQDRRLQVMNLLSASNSMNTATNLPSHIASGGIQLESGDDGNLYSANGFIDQTDTIMGLVGQAYNGSLESTDGSIEQLPEVTYPFYEPDYIISGGWTNKGAEVNYAAMTLSQYREDCICLADTGGYQSTYEDDLTARLNDVPWNTWTAALYVQYRQIFDVYTGNKIYVSPVYHAIERHLYCDGAYFIAEPVAGIEKGAIQEPIVLAYKANHIERGDLLAKELNPVIKSRFIGQPMSKNSFNSGELLTV